jgi:hypothetical protein
MANFTTDCRRLRGAAALQERPAPTTGRFTRASIQHRSLLRDRADDHAFWHHHVAAGAAWRHRAPAVTAESVPGLERRPFMRVCCASCGRSAVSDALSAAELCRLISWEYDGLAALCVQCQWTKGATPSFVDRLDGDEPAEPKSWLERLFDGELWRGGPGRDA